MNVEGKRLALFGGNNIEEEVTRFRQKYHISVISFGNDPNARMHQYSDEQCYVDCTDEKIMHQMLKEKRIDGILCCSSEGIIRKAIGFLNHCDYRFYATEDQWNMLMNKRNFKELLKKHHLPAIPEYNEKAEFPIVVKPADNGGSFGITVCDNEEELEKAIEFARINSSSGQVLCEKFLDGEYFQFEIWMQNGKSYLPYVKERIFYPPIGNLPCQPFADIYPSKNIAIVQNELFSGIADIMRECRVENGACMFQGIIQNGVPYIMDTAFRLSGGMDYRMVEKEKGIDLVEAHIQYALTGEFGENFTPLEYPFQHQYVTVCIGLKNGIIAKISGVEEIRNLSSVYDIQQYYQEGDQMIHSGRFLQTAFRVFMKSEEKEIILHDIETIYRTLQILDSEGKSLLLDVPEFR